MKEKAVPKKEVEKTPSYKDIRQCIGLLNSMVRGGEKHSDVSRESVRKALWALDELEGKS